MGDITFGIHSDLGFAAYKPEATKTGAWQPGVEFRITPQVGIPLTAQKNLDLQIGLGPTIAHVPSRFEQTLIGGHARLGLGWRATNNFVISPYVTARAFGFTDASKDSLIPYQLGPHSLRSQVDAGGGVQLQYTLGHGGVGITLDAQAVSGTRYYDVIFGQRGTHQYATPVIGLGIGAGIAFDISKLAKKSHESANAMPPRVLASQQMRREQDADADAVADLDHQHVQTDSAVLADCGECTDTEIIHNHTVIIRALDFPARVLFATGKSDFSSIQNPSELDQFVAAITEHLDAIHGKIQVTGYASSTGFIGIENYSATEHDSNRRLANERAQTIVDFLVRKFPALSGRIEATTWSDNSQVLPGTYQGGFYTGDIYPRTNLRFSIESSREYPGLVKPGTARNQEPEIITGSDKVRIPKPRRR